MATIIWEVHRETGRDRRGKTIGDHTMARDSSSTIIISSITNKRGPTQMAPGKITSCNHPKVTNIIQIVLMNMAAEVSTEDRHSITAICRRRTSEAIQAHTVRKVRKIKGLKGFTCQTRTTSLSERACFRTNKINAAAPMEILRSTVFKMRHHGNSTIQGQGT